MVFIHQSPDWSFLRSGRGTLSERQASSDWECTSRLENQELGWCGLCSVRQLGNDAPDCASVGRQHVRMEINGLLVGFGIVMALFATWQLYLWDDTLTPQR